MAGTSNQSPKVTPRRGDGDIPLAIHHGPMSVQNSRTPAVLPTGQTTNVPSYIYGSSTSSSCSTVIASVLPQQVHSAREGMISDMDGKVMSTASSHTDYMPATRSAVPIVVADVSPMGKAYTLKQTISEFDGFEAPK